MKMILGLLALTCSLGTFASESAYQRIETIEGQRGVSCRIKSSSMPICLGTERETATCISTYTFICSGEESLQVKIRMKEFYNNRLGARDSKPIKVKIKKI